MSQEMKLLRALIDALGFEIETTIDRKEQKEPTDSVFAMYNRLVVTERQLLRKGQALDIDSDGLCTSYLVNPIIDYKLTKKEQAQ